MGFCGRGSRNGERVWGSSGEEVDVGGRICVSAGEEVEKGDGFGALRARKAMWMRIKSACSLVMEGKVIY
jgi:hypothetical protein